MLMVSTSQQALGCSMAVLHCRHTIQLELEQLLAVEQKKSSLLEGAAARLGGWHPIAVLSSAHGACGVQALGLHMQHSTSKVLLPLLLLPSCLPCSGFKYGSRNVLADQGIREGIKKFTQWPTIPQVRTKLVHCRRWRLPTWFDRLMHVTVSPKCMLPTSNVAFALGVHACRPWQACSQRACPQHALDANDHAVWDRPAGHDGVRQLHVLSSAVHSAFHRQPCRLIRLLHGSQHPSPLALPVLRLQVFVKGEFVGGSDVLMEMHKAGELQHLAEELVDGSK